MKNEMRSRVREGYVNGDNHTVIPAQTHTLDIEEILFLFSCQNFEVC